MRAVWWRCGSSWWVRTAKSWMRCRVGEGVLIIGYGSWLRGDDAAGRLAARRLAERGFDAVDVHQLTPELADRVASAGTVVFLDADAGLAPGAVTVRPVTP